jgi:hypothetical protein
MKKHAGIEKWASGALGVVSLLLAVYMVNQLRNTHHRLARTDPGPKAAAHAHPVRVRSRAADELSRYDPLVNLEVLKELDSRPLPETKRSLFSFVEPPPPPAPPISPVLTQTAAAAPPPPPPPPPIQVKIVGYNESPGGPKRAIASYKDEVQMVQEGDVVGLRYRILKITSVAVLVEDATSHETTQLPIPQ